MKSLTCVLLLAGLFSTQAQAQSASRVYKLCLMEDPVCADYLDGMYNKVKREFIQSDPACAARLEVAPTQKLLEVFFQQMGNGGLQLSTMRPVSFDEMFGNHLRMLMRCR